MELLILIATDAAATARHNPRKGANIIARVVVRGGVLTSKIRSKFS